jgi:hypothetical protein
MVRPKGTGGEIVAEFSEAVKQLGRICASNYGECDICDLRPFCPSKTFLDKYAKSGRAERLEEMVMQWAAEHPEPVYSTWEEWLQSVGVMESSEGLLRRIQGQLLIDGIPAHAVPTSKVLQPMDADIAQKLGIEPKEG